MNDVLDGRVGLKIDGGDRFYLTGVQRFSVTFDRPRRHELGLCVDFPALWQERWGHDASAIDVDRQYRSLERVERRFRVLKDFFGLRPIYHSTEKRVRGHIALSILAVVIEAVMTHDLEVHRVMDPDLKGQVLSPRRALRELDRIRAVRLVGVDGIPRQVITRPSPLQSQILAAFDVDTMPRCSEST